MQGPWQTTKMSRDSAAGLIHGWIIIDKPSGPSSAAVIARLKHLLHVRKAGHAGTLDPLASGILPVAIGEATKTIRWVTDREKTYRFTLRFGETRDTDDAAGQVVDLSPVRPKDDGIRETLALFTGSIEQVPPVYSAIKVDGQRAYARARAGEPVTLRPRRVTVKRFSFLDRPDTERARFEVVCGKGTYIRSLARDLAEALGTCGHVQELRRTAVGSFSEDDAISLDNLERLVHSAALKDCLLPVTAALDDIPALAVTETQADHLRRGGAFRVSPERVFPTEASKTEALRNGEVLCALAQSTPVALARLVGDEIRPVRVFNL